RKACPLISLIGSFFPQRAQRHAEAQEAASRCRVVPVAVRRSTVTGVAAPAPATDHSAFASLGALGIAPTWQLLPIRITAPFIHVSMHIVESPGIRLLLPYAACVVFVIAPRILAEPGIIAELRGVVAETEVRLGSSPARAFPLSLSRHRVFPVIG